MKIKYSDYRGTHECDLSSWVEGSLDGETDGMTERAKEQADNNSYAIGVICEKLVDKGILKLDDMADICRCYDELGPVDT